MANPNMATPPELGVSRTLSAAIVDRLRDTIIHGDLRPGERLWQDRLAERFGVSRIPIREALRQLAAEGLVTLQSHRSAEVARLSAKDIEEVFAIAGTLEALASERAVAVMSAAQIEESGRLLREMAHAKTDMRRWFELNVAFHMALLDAADWPRLTRLVQESRQNLMRYIAMPGLHAQEIDNWHAQHIAIQEACERRDSERARMLAEHHWRYAADAVIHFLADHGGPALRPDGDAETR